MGIFRQTYILNLQIYPSTMRYIFVPVIFILIALSFIPLVVILGEKTHGIAIWILVGLMMIGATWFNPDEKRG